MEKMPNEHISKFANEITAGQQDSGDATVTREFAEAMVIAQPVAPLEEKGVIEVKQVGPNTDKVVFTVIPESTFSWRTIDVRGSEVGGVRTYPSGSLQAMSAPTYKIVTPSTKSTTIFIHDNINLVNPVDFQTLAEIAGRQIKQFKINEGLAELFDTSLYVAGTSIYNAGGYTAKGAVAGGNTLSPSDLAAAKDDLKSDATSPIIANVAVMHTNQIRQLEAHADFSPGNLSNANFKKARFGADGRLVAFDGMEIIEYLEAESAIVTTGDFSGTNGHYCAVSEKRLMLGRGENNRKNTVEDWRDPKEHGTERTLNVNFDYCIKYPNAIRLLQCAT